MKNKVLITSSFDNKIYLVDNDSIDNIDDTNDKIDMTGDAISAVFSWFINNKMSFDSDDKLYIMRDDYPGVRLVLDDSQNNLSDMKGAIN